MLEKGEKEGQPRKRLDFFYKGIFFYCKEVGDPSTRIRAARGRKRLEAEEYSIKCIDNLSS